MRNRPAFGEARPLLLRIGGNTANGIRPAIWSFGDVGRRRPFPKWTDRQTAVRSHRCEGMGATGTRVARGLGANAAGLNHVNPAICRLAAVLIWVHVRLRLFPWPATLFSTQ